MKINPLHQTEAINKYSNIVSTRPQSAAKPGISDNLELSEGAQKYSALLKSAKEAMETAGVDEELKVSDIINRIKNNSYDVSAEKVAESILGGILK